MVDVIKMIIDGKRLALREPYIATAYEVYTATGLTREQQHDEAQCLAAAGVIKVGNTFNDVYYSLP